MNFKVTQKARKAQKCFFKVPQKKEKYAENDFMYEISIRLIRLNSLLKK